MTEQNIKFTFLNFFFFVRLYNLPLLYLENKVLNDISYIFGLVIIIADITKLPEFYLKSILVNGLSFLVPGKTN